jgi:hypothetical protein
MQTSAPRGDKSIARSGPTWTAAPQLEARRMGPSGVFPRTKPTHCDFPPGRARPTGCTPLNPSALASLRTLGTVQESRPGGRWFWADCLRFRGCKGFFGGKRTDSGKCLRKEASPPKSELKQCSLDHESFFGLDCGRRDAGPTGRPTGRHRGWAKSVCGRPSAMTGRTSVSSFDGRQRSICSVRGASAAFGR